MATPTASTGSQVITDALRWINVCRETETPSPEQFATGVRCLNQMMAEWEIDGGALGYIPIGTPTDVLPLPDGAVRGVTLHLAIALCIPFSTTASEELRGLATQSMVVLDRLRAQEVQANLGELPLPANLSGWPGRSITTG